MKKKHTGTWDDTTTGKGRKRTNYTKDNKGMGKRSEKQLELIRHNETGKKAKLNALNTITITIIQET